MKYIIATIRLIWIGLTMGTYIGAYYIKSLWSPPTLERGFKLRKDWARIGFWTLGLRVEVTGEVPDKPVLFVANHRSLVDPMIIAIYCDAFVLAKNEVSKYPFLGKGAEATGVVFVKRESQTSRSAAREAIRSVFERGENVMVFPEGTTVTTKLTIPMSIGSFVEAAEYGIPVIPVVLEYRDQKDLWSGKPIFTQFFNQFGVWNTYTKLDFGPKIIGDDPHDLLARTQQYMDDKLTEMHIGWTNMTFDEVQAPKPYKVEK